VSVGVASMGDAADKARPLAEGRGWESVPNQSALAVRCYAIMPFESVVLR